MDIRGVVGESGQIRPARRNQEERAPARWSPLNLYFKLKRRGVLQTGTSYVVVAWLVAQVAELIGEIFGAPAWLLQGLLIALALGLPVALVLAWTLELTPRGLRRDSDASPPVAGHGQKGRGLLCVVIALMVLAIGLLAVERGPGVCAITPETSVQSGGNWPPK